MFAAIVIALVFCDLDMLILPDEFTIGGLVAGLVFALFTPVPDTTFHLIRGSVRHVTCRDRRVGIAGEALLGAIVVPAGEISGNWAAGCSKSCGIKKAWDSGM